MGRNGISRRLWTVGPTRFLMRAGILATISIGLAPDVHAQHASAAAALNDPHVCWVLQTIHVTGLFRGEFRDAALAAPGDSPKFNAYTQGRVERAGSNDPLSGTEVIYSSNYSSRLVAVPCGQISTNPNGGGLTGGTVVLLVLEGGIGGARATYDDFVIHPRSWVGGISAGVRSYQPYNMFLGAQVSVLGTDLTKEAVPGFSVGMQWGVPVDIQVGRTFQAGSTPFSVYGFVGPMWVRTRVSSFGATDYFTLLGATAGLGVDVQLNQNWFVGATVRGFTAGPSDRRSEGQHLEGELLTLRVGRQF